MYVTVSSKCIPSIIIGSNKYTDQILNRPDRHVTVHRLATPESLILV